MQRRRIFSKYSFFNWFIQWKFPDLAIPKIGVIPTFGRFEADREAQHLQHWGPALRFGFPGGFIPEFGIGKNIKST